MTIERELKLALPDTDSAERLARELPGEPETIRQRNRYFDAPGRPLTRARVLLRVRATGDGAVVITVKRRAEVSDDGTFQAIEIEETVPPAHAESFFASARPFETYRSPVVDGLAEEFGPFESLEEWGAMQNRRRVFPLDGGLVVEVDITDFGNGVRDAEIEIECEDSFVARRALDPYLERARVDVRPQRLTKSARLRRAAGLDD